MTTRWPKKWKFVPPDPWWTATHLAPPEINPGPAPELVARSSESGDHPVVKAVADRFQGAEVVRLRSGSSDAETRPMSDVEWAAYCEEVVYLWRNVPFQDSRDLAETDRLRGLYARLRWWRPPCPSTPFRPGTGVLKSVEDYVRKTESHRAEPWPDTLALLALDLKAERKAARAAARAAAKARENEPAAD